MSIILIGKTLDVIGKILLGIAVLNVHKRLFKEHKIDNVVLREIKQEQYITVFGIAFIILGFILQLPKELHIDFFWPLLTKIAS